MSQADIGLVGLAVMGQNLVLNFSDHEFQVAVYNRTTSRVDEFLSGAAQYKNVLGYHSVEEFCQNLKRPRRILLMVKAGTAVDDTISVLLPHLDADDIIIDGGNSLFSDTSTEGLYVIGSSDVLLEKNIFRRNNVEELTGYYPAAVKIFNQSYRVTCRDNLVMDNPNSNGIWYDVGDVDGVFVNNWVQDCLDGFFFEICKGAICAGNVFVNCNNGIRVLNSSNVRAWHNTLIDSVASFERDQRSATGDHFGWHPATGPDVDEREGHVFCGNLLVASEQFSKPLLRFRQSPALAGKLTKPQVTQLDGNVYVRSETADPAPLLVWSPVTGGNGMAECKTVAEFQKLCPPFEAHSKAITSPLGALFKSPDLKRYELIQDVSLPASAAPMPDEVRHLLDWPKQDTILPGAYPIADR